MELACLFEYKGKERLADVLSRGFVLPDKDHVYSLNSQWRVADCSRGVPFAHINEARREFPPAVEAHALHGAYDAFEIYINVAPSDSGMKSYVQLASFWRGNGGVGFDVSIMPDTCFEAFVFLEAARGAGESLYFSLCRGDIADGEDVFFLSFAVDGRTMSVDTVRCTMWDLL